MLSRGFVDCYFEAMSGLTTTGATVLSDIDSMPRGLLLWRALTHWLGGLGIVVLFVAVLPTLGVGGKKIFHVEAPGPTHAGVKPRIKETARILWTIYMVLTAAQIVALLCCGMSLFESVCHTFATVATGGFSTRNASVGAPDYGLAVNLVVIVFMVLAGVNFGLYYHAMRGAFNSIWKDTELRLYLALFSGGSLIVVASLIFAGEPLLTTGGQQIDASVGAATEHGVFAVASIITTTGFGTADFNVWPFIAQAVLVGLMFIGGCAGSTGGGIKVVRFGSPLKFCFQKSRRLFVQCRETYTHWQSRD